MRGGMKRKIDIVKLESKEQRAVAFSKRRKGLLKKVAKLSVASGATTAIFADSPSENRDAIYSFFANSNSAYEIAHCFLNNKIPSNPNPNPNPTSGGWWEDVEAASFMDPNLMDYLHKTENELMASLARKLQNQYVPVLFQNPNLSPLLHQIPYHITNEITNQLSDKLPNQIPSEITNEITNQLPNESPNKISNQVSINGGGWPSEIEEEATAVELATGNDFYNEDWWQELADEYYAQEEDHEGSLEHKKFAVPGSF